MILAFIFSFCQAIVPVDSASLSVHKHWEFKSAKYLKDGAFGMDKIKTLDLTNQSVLRIEIDGEKKWQSSKYKVVDNFIVILNENGSRITDADFDIRIASLSERELTLVIVAHFVINDNAVEGDLVEMIFTERTK